MIKSKAVIGSTLVLSDFPDKYLWDFNETDAITDYKVRNATYDNEILNPELDLEIENVDKQQGVITCWSESNHHYVISGAIEIETRWLNKSEVLKMANEVKFIYETNQYNVNIYKKIIEENKKNMEDCKKFVKETSKRSEIKINAGKKVNTLKILSQIDNILSP